MTVTSLATCDLHTHSHFSDGSLSPAALLQMADELGLGALALTDHNTVAGLPAFLEAASHTAVRPVAGVELSSTYRTNQGREVELHVLGLFLPVSAWAAVTDFTADYALRKEESNRALVDALCRHGYTLDYGALRAATPDGNINRAHIAGALLRAGYVSSTKEAFASLLSPKGGLYVPPLRPSAPDTVAFIRSVGGMAVLAHPLLSMTTEETDGFLPEAIAYGLQGIETRYVTYDEATTGAAMALAQRHGMLESGGSDFHGEAKPDIFLGTGRGDLRVPMEIYEALAQKAGG